MPPLHVSLQIRGLIEALITRSALVRRNGRMDQLMFPQVINLCKLLLARLALERLINEIVLLVAMPRQ